jgi:hypothetical protein
MMCLKINDRALREGHALMDAASAWWRAATDQPARIRTGARP